MRKKKTTTIGKGVGGRTAQAAATSQFSTPRWHAKGAKLTARRADAARTKRGWK